MKNKLCIVCGYEFAPRNGKLYCSNTCKQEAFKNKADYQQLRLGVSPIQAGSNTHGYVVNFAEWLDFKQLLNEDDEISLSEYYFIRLMFDSPYNRDLIINFFSEFYEEFGNAFKDKSSALYVNYQMFKKMIQMKQVRFVMEDFSFAPMQIGPEESSPKNSSKYEMETELVAINDGNDSQSKLNKTERRQNGYAKYSFMSLSSHIYSIFRKKIYKFLSMCRC